MNRLSAESLFRGLQLLEEQMRGNHSKPAGLVICGGSALIAMGLASRTTKDVDVVALWRGEGELQFANPLPSEIIDAAKIVSSAMRLPQDWLNAGPASLLSLGLPGGFTERLTERILGPTLTVYFISRFDQIHFKLYAAVDRGGYHISDLLALSPTTDELVIAGQWTMTHDISEAFRELLNKLLFELGYTDAIQRL